VPHKGFDLRPLFHIGLLRCFEFPRQAYARASAVWTGQHGINLTDALEATATIKASKRVHVACGSGHLLCRCHPYRLRIRHRVLLAMKHTTALDYLELHWRPSCRGKVYFSLRISRYERTDFAWRVIRPFLPNKLTRVPHAYDRRTMSGIFSALRSGAPWRAIARAACAPSGGSGATRILPASAPRPNAAGREARAG
jgi:hypothetical protein